MNISSFMWAMALLDLNKIIIHRTSIGITCAYCGGNLIERQAAFGKFVATFSIRRVNYGLYKCEKCNKKYHLLSKA